MLVTAIEGVIENGQVRLREDVTLAENTRVFVIVADLQALAPTAQISSPRLINPQEAQDFRKQVLEAPVNAKV